MFILFLTQCMSQVVDREAFRKHKEDAKYFHCSGFSIIVRFALLSSYLTEKFCAIYLFILNPFAPSLILLVMPNAVTVFYAVDNVAQRRICVRWTSDSARITGCIWQEIKFGLIMENDPVSRLEDMTNVSLIHRMQYGHDAQCSELS